MTDKRFIRTITGEVYDNQNDEFIDEEYEGAPIGYEDGVVELLNELHEENEYLCEKIKENEWHWNTIDEDRDVWMYKCKRLEEENRQLRELLENGLEVSQVEIDEELKRMNKLNNRSY